MTQKIEFIRLGLGAGTNNSLPVTGNLFSHPDEVLHHPTMHRDDKKALLASWASDSRSVENAPGLRQLDSGALVEIDDIIRALRAIDEQKPAFTWHSAPRVPYSARRPFRQLAKWRSRSRRTGSDDDGPPPSGPAAATIFPWPVRSCSDQMV
jgi:hypothetical protein